MSQTISASLTHESLDVDASPVVQQFLNRLNLPALFEQHLPTRPGRAPDVPTAPLLTLIIHNLLLDHLPIYAIAPWAAKRVPDYLDLTAEQIAVINDDRLGRALDHLFIADRASLMTALVKQAVTAFEIDLHQFHQDTTTITFSGSYDNQPDAAIAARPPLITHGYNKDHRPDLKQLIYSATISADGAVPVHAKIYDGNTTDDAVHIETWNFLHLIAGHANFLYVADSKLCSRENMAHIADRGGRFLTVMPRTRAEYAGFCAFLDADGAPVWDEVHREPNSRRKDDPDVVYHGWEDSNPSSEGYRILWYRSSPKEQTDRESRVSRLARARADLSKRRRKRPFDDPAAARSAAERIRAKYHLEELLQIEVETIEDEHREQCGPGRPGPDTEYRVVTRTIAIVRFVEDREAIERAARRDGIFPLMTNDRGLTVAEALKGYKYQPFIEKRHEQLKTVFEVAPVWLKNPERISSLLWLHFVVELVSALIERELRHRMADGGVKRLALYPDGGATQAPTSALVFRVLNGIRRHRLLEDGIECRRFHDPLPDVARQMLELLGVPLGPYGIKG